MARIAVQFVATGNMAPLQAQIKSVNAQLATMSTQMNATGARGVQSLAALRASWAANVTASGAYTVSTMKVATATATATSMLQRQEITLKNRAVVMRHLNALTAQQTSLAAASAMQWSRTANAATGSLIIPNKALDSAKALHHRHSIMNQTLTSIAANGIKAGKNMQWAGRQLTMGISLPIIALGVVSAKAAKDIDAEMTRLIKVYGDMAGTSEAELERVRKATMQTAKESAKQYGIMAKDTVAMGAELAAQGYQGEDLQKQISETNRIMMLGEIDQATALKGTISIRQVYNKTAEETAETFNRLNAIENATTITTNELMMAIPKAAGATRQAGGSVEYLSAMLAAMRENGVSDISRAANSISSSMIAIAKPVPQTVRMFNAVGVSIEDMANKHRGDLKGLMEELAGLWTTMDATQRIQLFGQLFGKHRYKEMSELLSSISEQMQAGEVSVNSYGKSLEVISASASSVRKVADTEIERMRKSASKQFDILRAQLNAALAEFGTPLMQVANFILKPIVALVQAFNAMPSLLKQLGIGFLVFTALVGPVVMLTGLFKTFLYSIAQAVASLWRWGAGLTPVITQEQRLAEIIGGRVVPTMADQMYQTGKLMASVKLLNNSLAEQVRLQQAAASGAAGTAAAAARATNANTIGAAALRRQEARRAANFYTAPNSGRTAKEQIGRNQDRRGYASVNGGAPQQVAPNGTAILMGPGGQAGIVGTREARRQAQATARSAAMPAHGVPFRSPRREGSLSPVVMPKHLPPTRGGKESGYTRNVLKAERAAHMENNRLIAQGAREEAKKAAASAQHTKNVQAAGQRYAGAASTVAMVGGMTGMIAGGTNKWVTGLSQVALVLAMITPLWTRLGKAVATASAKGVAARAGGEAAATATRGAKAMGMLQTAARGAFTAIKFMARFLTGPFGLAIAAVVGGVMLLNKHQQRLKEQANDAAFAAKDLAKGLGLAWDQTARKMTPAQKKLDDINNAVKDLKKNQKGSLDAINREADEVANRTDGTADEKNRAREEAVLNRVRTIGSQWVLHGVDPKQAQQQVDTLLTALGEQDLKVKLNFDFGDPVAVQNQLRAQYGEVLGKIIANDFKRGWRDSNWFGDEMTIPDTAIEALKSQMDDLAHTINPLLTGESNDHISAQAKLASYTTFMVDQYGTAMQDMKGLDEARAEAVAHGFEDSQRGLAQYVQAHLNAGGRLGGVFKEVEGALRRVNDAEKQGVRLLMTRLNLKESDLPTREENVAVGSDESGTIYEKRQVAVLSFAAVQEMLNNKFKTAQQVQAEYNAKMAAMGDRLEKLTPQAKAAIAQQLLMEGGLTDVSAASVMAGTAVADVGKKIDETAESALEATKDYKAMAEAFSSNLRSTSSAALQDYVDQGLKEFDRQTEVEAAGYDRRKDASDQRYDDEIEAAKDGFRVREDLLGDEERRARKTHEDSVKTAVEAINKQVDAAEKLDQKREKLFQAELRRMQRLAEAANRGIDFNVALDTGKLDEAARIMNAASVQDVQWSMEDATELGSDAAAARRAAADRRIQGIEDAGAKESDRLETIYDEKRRILDEEKDTEVRRLEIAKEGARDRIDNEKAMYAEARAAQKETIEAAARMEVEAGAASLGQFTTRAGKIRSIFEDNKIDLKIANDKWNSGMAGAFKASVDKARNAMQIDQGWATAGAQIADLMASGATGGAMTWDEVMTYLATGKKPDNPSGAGEQNGRPASANAERWNHAGGMAGQSSGRAGRPLNAGLYKDEIPTVLQQGEYVIQREAVKKIGKNNLDQLNQGTGVQGVFRHGGGFLGGPAAAIAGTMAGRMQEALRIAVERKDAELMAAGATPDQTVFGGVGGAQALADAIGLIQAGRYGDMDLTQEQVTNAAKIMSVGRSMGGSDHDLVIGLMTAMQESRLRNLNYGDRDSLGLFQQRPSQGWGTPAQIMNPDYSARKFFSALFNVRDRNAMQPTLAAQAVQRSAFPYLYAQWENEARALLAAASAATAEQQASGVIPSSVKFVSGLQNLQAPDQDATWRRANGRNWMTGLAPGVAPTVAGVLAGIPGAQRVTSALRTQAEQMSVNPGVPNSDHTRGKGIDIAASSIVNGGTAESQAMGDLIAQTFRSLPGVKNVLWRTMQGGNHHNHVHVSFRHGGGMVEGFQGVPGLKTGGFTLNDGYAKLHKSEAVLTAPLTRDLQEGIQNMDNSRSAVYNVNVTAGAGVDVKALAREVRGELEKFELRKGTNRRVG